MTFGAKGDGVTDDAVALNATYVAARKAQASVFLRGRQYRVTGQVDARGVSTIGEGATIKFDLNNTKNSNAFVWGGSDTLVTETRFDLSNSGPDAMLGIFNSVLGASNQRFFRNRIICHTRDASRPKSNIYGLWFTGTGLTGLYVEDNQIEGCSYGIQLNVQEGMTGDVRKRAAGKPLSHIHITGNSLIDSTIGVNTPHVDVSDVVIDGNTITPNALSLDLPLNVAHASKIAISNNTVTSNANSSNGTLHVEDASGSVTVTGNSVTVNGRNNGIEIGVKPSASRDAAPTTRVVVTGNHVEGAGMATDTVGILLPDGGTFDTTISGNYVARFSQCVNSVGPSNISSNTLSSCIAPIKSSKSSSSSNVIKN
ncbi:hypothetical protein [Burkholderia sp. Bp9090]|uniref:hypothetical protein n=1 Tax=Burkholderia sp. Bp9090 TaxID=2184567 RepID=UPI000F5FC4D3|nr:hypothetical protein [Burkholderia sp. Bp9090]